MTSEQKHKHIIERVAYWKERLCVDPRVSIIVAYETPGEDMAEAFASADFEKYEYFKVIIRIYQRVLSASNFKAVVDSVVCHELLHVLLAPYTTYCDAMMSDDQGKSAHLGRLEESIVCCLERALTPKASAKTHRDSCRNQGTVV